MDKEDCVAWVRVPRERVIRADRMGEPQLIAGRASNRVDLLQVTTRSVELVVMPGPVPVRAINP